jgi:hypothetical protein
MVDVPKFFSKLGNQERHDGLVALYELRKRGGAAPMDFGVVELSIPTLDYEVITRRYPDLVSPDAEISKRAWDKFIQSSESSIYKTRRAKRTMR